MPLNKKKGGAVTSGVIAKYTLVVLAILATALFFWQIKDAFLVAFAGVILAVIITGFARLLRRFLPISRGWSLASVGVLTILLIGLFGFLFGSQIVKEFEELTEQLPQQIEQIGETIRGWPLGEDLLDGENDEQEENGNDENGEEENSLNEELAGEASGMIFEVGVTIVDVLSTLILILFIGIFFAIDPEIYKKGVALLFTKRKADRINEALETTGNALWNWLSGQFIAMAFVAVTVTIGLMIIGVPLALVLGIIAGLAEFVPIIGPFIGAFPAILLALSVDTTTAIYTTVLYLIIQQIESNILTPVIQRKMVYIPPAIVIISVVAFGLVFGIPGVILATPLAVVTMVLVGMFYVQDVLGKEVTIPGKD